MREELKLTDDECNAFRRLPCSFNDMVRAIYAAGALAEREACAQICDNTGPDDTTGENCASAIRGRSET